MDVPTFLQAAAAALELGGFLYAAGRVSGKISDNTKATDKLTGVFEKFVDKTDATLVDHEVRISVLEADKDKK